jgi:hypothetical protein
MTTIPDRIVEVRIGQSGGAGFSWAGPLFITFDVEPHAGRTPSKGTVVLNNLNNDSVAYIESPNQVIQLLAGETVPNLLFQGDIHPRDSGTKWNGPTRVTTIKAADGRRIFRDTNFTGSYPPNTERDTILPDVIAAMGVKSGYIVTLPPKQYPAGWVWAGRGARALDDLLGPDATWSIQNGALQILLTGEPLPGNAVVISAATGMIGSPERTKNGANFRHRLDPRIRPGGPVRIESREFTGDCRVTKARHLGDSWGQRWETSGSAVLI